MAGARSKLTPERSEAITSALRLGLSYTLACQAAGITYNTFRNWLDQGEQLLNTSDDPDPSDYIDFYLAVKLAEAECARSRLAIINAAADNGTWTAAAWVLERRFPKDFSQRTATELSGPDGTPLAIPIQVVEVIKDPRDPDAVFDQLMIDEDLISGDDDDKYIVE